MFILDTNVVSELFRPMPADAVVAWIGRTDPADLYVTAISTAEMLLGVALMPPGRRRDGLEHVLRLFFAEKLRTGILAFGDRESTLFAELVAHRRGIGRPIGEFDAQIAAIARAHGFSVVTRNVRDFDDCGVGVVNPWSAS